MRKKIILLLFLCMASGSWMAATQPCVVVDSRNVCFRSEPGNELFVPYGVNYDHDKDFRLIEKFWGDTDLLNRNFSEIRKMGFNTVRIHVQQFVLQKGTDSFDETNLKNLDKLIKMAADNSLYIDLTGLGRYEGIIPDWYESLDDKGRIKADVSFWRTIAKRYKGNAAIFCFDIQNEPIINNKDHQGFTGEPFNDGYRYINRHFQDIENEWNIFLHDRYKDNNNTLPQWFKKKKAGENIGLPSGFIIPEAELRDFLDFQDSLAVSWLKPISSAIRSEDPARLITLGLSEMNFPFSEYYSSFDPRLIAPYVDFISIHVYPATITQEPYKDNKDSVRLLMRASYVDKPIVVEEMFPLVPLDRLYDNYLDLGRNSVNGWLSFYWGRSVSELKSTGRLDDGITADWLEYFSGKRVKIIKTEFPLRAPGIKKIEVSKLHLRMSGENRKDFIEKYETQAGTDTYVDVEIRDK